MPQPPLAVRLAAESDGPALQAVERAAFTPQVGPQPPRSTGTPFFTAHSTPGNILVAEAGERIAGYVRLDPHPLAAAAHVQMVNGLSVHPDHRRQGIARTLMEAAGTLARGRGARRITLRVMGGNDPAQRLYRSLGYVEEGRLREEFLVDGAYVDDVFMALTL